MTRPLHLEFAGALYQLTARGDRQAAIFVDDCKRRFIVTPLNAAMTQKAKDLLQKYGKIKALRALDALYLGACAISQIEGGLIFAC